MKRFWENLLGRRLWPLFVKELQQLKRNRRLVIMLIIPPTMNIVLFGFALNPEVSDLRLGIVDQSRTNASREFVSAFTESRSFRISSYYVSTDELGRALAAGKLDAGLVIPYDFARKRARHETAEVQLLVDAVNSNTAAIAAGYAARLINEFNQRAALAQTPPLASAQTPALVQSTTPANVAANTSAATTQDTSAPSTSASSTSASSTSAASASVASASASSALVSSTSVNLSTGPVVALNNGGPLIGRASITPRVALLYNPGLSNAWFITTGLIGTLLVLQGSLVAAASMVKEKEGGTVEQLLMTPAEASEIITAKIAPIFLLLTADIGLSLIVVRLVFGVPVRGSLLLLFFAGSLCVLSGIGIGTLIATFTRSQQQAQLMSFFVNPPVAMLSGATTPIEAMPNWLQPLTYLNPVRHFATISRGVMLKGTGLDVLYPNVLALLCFAFLLVGVSAWRFRKQLG